jgi:hypothetical protein
MFRFNEDLSDAIKDEDLEEPRKLHTPNVGVVLGLGEV